MQQRHHRNGEASIAELLELIAHSATNSKRLEFMPLGIDPPLHLHHRFCQEGPRGLAQREQVIPMLVADAQQVAEAGIGHQQKGCTTPLQQGIGGHGGAEAQLLDAARRQRQPRRQIQQFSDGRYRRITIPLRLHREHLAHVELPVGGTPHQIGEGAAAIHPKPPGHQPMAA